MRRTLPLRVLLILLFVVGVIALPGVLTTARPSSGPPTAFLSAERQPARLASTVWLSPKVVRAAARPSCRADRQSWPVAGPAVAYTALHLGVCNAIIRSLPAPERQVAVCIAWAESRDHAFEAGGGYGLFQFEPVTWTEFARSWANRWPLANQAPIDIQSRVLVRAWKAEQWNPWEGDPCVGHLTFGSKFGWQPST